MAKKILFIGDIVGKPGRQILKNQLPAFIRKNEIDFVIANGENAAAGAGISKSLAQEIHQSGVDVITLGDHVWDQKGFEYEIEELPNVCRPANLPEVCPGKDMIIFEKDGYKIGVVTLLGQVFMKVTASSPFLKIDDLLPELKEQVDAVIVEIHAEATSEKVAMGFYLDGKVSLVVGTHTHIPTADASILPMGTAYQTDAGMTGPYHSILGREIQPIIDRMRDGMPRRFPVASDNVMICGCMVTLKENGLAQKIESVKIRSFE
jgi:2',3'-cyclic-nucleotide 2'-phosphodiesterase